MLRLTEIGRNDMATSRVFIDQFLAGLDLYGVRVYPMMGEYIVYCDDKSVGCICDEKLFVKITPASRKVLDGAPEIPPYTGAKPRYLVENEDKEFLAELLRSVAAELPAPKKRK